jgi:hypothetical protein
MPEMQTQNPAPDFTLHLLRAVHRGGLSIPPTRQSESHRNAVTRASNGFVHQLGFFHGKRTMAGNQTGKDSANKISNQQWGWRSYGRRNLEWAE